MEFENRWYQVEAANCAVEDILSEKNYNPVTVMPTGSGKSVTQCLTVDEFLTEKPQQKVLCLSHVDKILNQNYTKLCEYFDEDFVGLYSAGLGQRTLNKITVAGIQSVYKRPELFHSQNIGLIVVDECHLVNSKDDGMYRGFIKNLKNYYGRHIPIWGMTATPYRTGQGYIYKKYQGYDPLFNKLSYDLSSFENYNKLIDEGYLVNLIPAPTDYKMDIEGISIQAGDFVIDALADKFNREEITKHIVKSVIKYGGKKYKKWLGFAIDKLHALSIKYEFEQNGIVAECIYSGMKKDQHEILADFKSGKIKCLINVNMLTTGLDIPEIDLIFHARPTQSPIFHGQSNGRGARPAPWIGKTHCLVLDFAGNTDRLGPVNDMNIFEPCNLKKGGKGEKVVKYCKNCGTANSTRVVFCIACDEEFKFEHKLNTNASNSNIVKRDEKEKPKLEQWLKVKSVNYSIHQKAGSPSSLRVVYNCGFNTFSEWICIDHDAEWLQRRAHKWVGKRWIGAKFHIPQNLNDLYSSVYNLRKPTEIFVSLRSKYPEILDYKFLDEEKKY
jgi:DNA repair protein RadD